MRFYLKEPLSATSYIWYQEGKQRASTHIKIPTKYWDKEKQCIKRGYPLYKEMNQKLKDFKPLSKNLILPFFYMWATEGTATKIHTRKEDLHAYNVFASFCPTDTRFSDIDYTFYNKYLCYLQNKGYAANTQGGHIKRLKAVMNEAFKRGLHNNMSYIGFHKPSEEVDAIYLTEEELDKIRQLDLCGMMEKVRDLFLVGCNTAMRYSDYSRIEKDWIREDELVFISTKTSMRQSVPLTKECRSIIEKYQGVPHIPQQVFNRNIKDICRRADLNTPVQIEKTIGREKIVRTVQKWELVSSHTARRTAATLLIKKGVPIAWVMSLTGHKSESSFWRYVKLSKNDYNTLLKSFML